MGHYDHQSPITEGRKNIFRHGLLALSAVFSGSTYIFSKERFLLLWILPFLLSFLFHALQEQSRLRSGRK